MGDGGTYLDFNAARPPGAFGHEQQLRPGLGPRLNVSKLYNQDHRKVLVSPVAPGPSFSAGPLHGHGTRNCSRASLLLGRSDWLRVHWTCRPSSFLVLALTAFCFASAAVAAANGREVAEDMSNFKASSSSPCPSCPGPSSRRTSCLSPFRSMSWSIRSTHATSFLPALAHGSVPRCSFSPHSCGPTRRSSLFLAGRMMNGRL